MRNLMVSLLLSTSMLAHGFWRAGSKLHHFFGAIFVVLVAVTVLPVSLVRRAVRDKGKQANAKDE